MSHTLTLRYNDSTQRVVQTYYGANPDWSDRDGTTITVTEADMNAQGPLFEAALSEVDETDYDPDTETPVPYLTYDPDTDTLGAEVEIRQRVD